MKKYYLLQLLSLALGGLGVHHLSADTITITNESSSTWSLAIYYVKNSAERASNIYTINPGETKEVERPERKLYRTFPPAYYDREATLSHDKENLLETFSLEEFDTMNHYNIGSKWGSTFYIIDTIEGIKLVTPAYKLTHTITTPLVETEADVITLHNESPQSYFYAVYYVGSKGSRATFIEKIAAGETKQVKRSGRRVLTFVPPAYFDRELVISQRKEVLSDELSIDQLDGITRGNIGSKWGSIFYIIDVSRKPKVVSTYEKTIETTLDDILVKKVPNPYRNKSAIVRHGNELCPEEAIYRKKRLPKVNEALKKVLGENIDEKQTPIIALTCSGGGIRASLFSTGCLSGLKQIDLFDTCTYMVGLSGSTWSIGSLVTTEKSIADFKEYMIKQTNRITTQSSDEYGGVTWAIVAKKAYGQLISPVDFYGGLLGNRLLESTGKNREFLGLSSQQRQLSSVNIPLPIYTAVSADEKTIRKWYEFTPYEIGAPWLAKDGAYVSSWGLGRKFWQGSSVDYSIELPFPHAMGIFGSAFSVAISEVLDRVPGHLPFGGEGVQKYAQKVIDQLLSLQEKAEFIARLGNKRITTARIHNFTRGIEDSPLGGQNSMKLVDAGVDFNLPYPPISGERPERKADIIIFCDASSSVKNSRALKGTEKYARARDLPYPIISDDVYATLDQHAVTIIKGEGNQPTIIYIPFVRDKSLDSLLDSPEYTEYQSDLKDFDPIKCTEKEFCQTTNFNYKEQYNQARKVIHQAEFNIKANRQLLTDIIKETITKKSNNNE